MLKKLSDHGAVLKYEIHEDPVVVVSLFSGGKQWTILSGMKKKKKPEWYNLDCNTFMCHNKTGVLFNRHRRPDGQN